MKENNIEAESPRVFPPFEQLVDRKEQLDKFTDVLDRINRQGPISSNLFEWYGSPGIGKSTLVHMLAHRAEDKHASYAIVDFKTSPEKEYRRDPIVLLEKIVDDLKVQITLDSREFDTALNEYRKTTLPDDGVVFAYAAMDQETRLYKRPEWLVQLRNVVIGFIKFVNLLPAQVVTSGTRPVALFFDETEHAAVELVDWIEEWVVNPLIQVRHCVVVWTARRPWRWKRPEIRRRLTSEVLNVFAPEMVKEQIQSGSNAPDLVKNLFKNVYTLTGGHPFANSIVIQELDELTGQGKKITPETFTDFQSQLLADVFHKFIDGYAFDGLASSELKTVCRYIALVRLFDSTMLREVLQACAGAPFTTWKQEDFGDILLQLKKTQLLVWEKGYALDGGLRHIIQKYFMVLEPQTFIKANQVALQVYKEWLDKPVDTRSLFVLEEIYHHAALSQVGEHDDLNALLEKRLKEYPNWFKDKNVLDNALERLEGEISNDKELEQLILSSADLVKQVQAFRDERLSLNLNK